jgi:hypothetical protein
MHNLLLKKRQRVLRILLLQLNSAKFEYLSARAESREIKDLTEIESVGIKRRRETFPRKTRSRVPS